MDIFKLIYEHDLRLDELSARSTDRNYRDMQASVEDFMRPDPTYSRFYLSGTKLAEERFGLSILDDYSGVTGKLQEALRGYRYFSRNGAFDNLAEVLESAAIWDAILLSGRDQPVSDLSALHLDSDSNAGHRKAPIRTALVNDEPVLYKEKAHHGFDLHLFSGKNIYRDLFAPLKELVSQEFRFFSMNGKRIQSERKFYFETWTLDRPPHGVEEVFEETVL